MIRYARIFFAIILALSMAIPALAESKTYTTDTLVMTDDETVTLSCDPNPAEDYVILYRFNLKCIETDQERSIETEKTTATFTRSRTGHFIASVQACNASACSDWTFSNEQEGYTKFIIFWRMPKPSYSIE